MPKQILISHSETVPAPSRWFGTHLTVQRPPATAQDTWDVEAALQGQGRQPLAMLSAASPARGPNASDVYRCLREGSLATLGLVSGAAAGALAGAWVGSVLAHLGTFMFVRQGDDDKVLSAAVVAIFSYLVGAATAVVGGASGAAWAVTTFSA